MDKKKEIEKIQREEGDTPAIGDAFYLEVECEDVFDGSKIRPVIIIDKRDDNIFLISTTSQKPKNPPSYYDL